MDMLIGLFPVTEGPRTYDTGGDWTGPAVTVSEAVVEVDGESWLLQTEAIHDDADPITKRYVGSVMRLGADKEFTHFMVSMGAIHRDDLVVWETLSDTEPSSIDDCARALHEFLAG